MFPVIQEAVEPHFDALKAQKLQETFLDTSAATSDALKRWISQWQTTLTK
ncbi:thiamin/thiamin pyrophosphate ABC transporter, thiamin/thiamin pyrophospate-binding protein [Aggregatibacter aphrophilus]|nr:thiamin/thiamin pyrophosphate ABC transporter, thiamin/thiamin pyrophospate-binding protein [Aggregatibacter aphrophilus]